MSIEAKLAETALLFCRVSDVPFLTKWNELKFNLAEIALLVSDSTPWLHSEASKDQSLVLFATCTLAAT